MLASCKCVEPSMEVRTIQTERVFRIRRRRDPGRAQLCDFREPAAVIETYLCYEIGTRPEEDDDEQQAYTNSVVAPSHPTRCRRRSLSCW